MILRLPPAERNLIVNACRAAFPAEACGLLVGRGRRILAVRRAVPAPNLLADTTDRFELDPRVRLAVERECRGTPDRILGHWHSHPGGRAEPSATDLSMAWEPKLIWLIVAIAPDGTNGIRAYRPAPSGTSFHPVPLALHEKSACITPAIPT